MSYFLDSQVGNILAWQAILQIQSRVRDIHNDSDNHKNDSSLSLGPIPKCHVKEHS